MTSHDDVIKWKHFPRNWPFVREIHRSPVNFPHKGQWRGALMFSLIYPWINDWVNNREAGDLRRQHGHYDVIVMNHVCQWQHRSLDVNRKHCFACGTHTTYQTTSKVFLLGTYKVVITISGFWLYLLIGWNRPVYMMWHIPFWFILIGTCWNIHKFSSMDQF